MTSQTNPESPVEGTLLPAMNTDRELWRESYNHNADSLHVTTAGGIGINIRGHVIVKKLSEWHSLAQSEWGFTKWRESGHASEREYIEDMANVGEALIEALPEGYSYSDCPSEIVADLMKERDDSLRALEAERARADANWSTADYFAALLDQAGVKYEWPGKAREPAAGKDIAVEPFAIAQALGAVLPSSIDWPTVKLAGQAAYNALIEAKSA